MSPVRHLGNDGSDVKQVVDLEVAADHRGSILGDHPTRLQPPQKMFESKLLHQMRNFSVDRPVFIESESSLVGRRQVPAAMWKVKLALSDTILPCTWHRAAHANQPCILLITKNFAPTVVKRF